MNKIIGAALTTALFSVIAWLGMVLLHIVTTNNLI